MTLTPDGKKLFLDINSGIDNHYCGTLDRETGDYFPYHLDPHPRFTQNEKYIVFTTSERGHPDLAIAPVAPLLEMTK